MLRNRKDYPQVITPKGTVAWASIDQPDYEYKPEGEFHVRLRFDLEDTDLSEMQAIADELLDEAYEAKKSELTKEKKGALLKKLHKVDAIKAEVDRESGDETGHMIIRAGMKHRIEIKNGKRAGEVFLKFPDVFDAKRKQVSRVTGRDENKKFYAPKIGSGSVVRLAVRPMEYFMAKEGEIGVRWELEGVQIIKLVQGGQRDASSYGFGEEEGDSLDDADTTAFDDEDGGYEADADEGDSDF